MAVNRLKSWVKFGLGIWYYYYKDDTNKKQWKLLTEFVNQPDSSTLVKTQYQSHPKTRKNTTQQKKDVGRVPPSDGPAPFRLPRAIYIAQHFHYPLRPKERKKIAGLQGDRDIWSPHKKKRKKKAHRMLCLVSSSGERKTRLGSGYIAQVEMAFPTADYHPNERLSEVKMRGEKFAYFKLFNCPAVLAVQLFRIY